jgi:hypothetical protein
MPETVELFRWRKNPPSRIILTGVNTEYGSDRVLYLFPLAFTVEKTMYGGYKFRFAIYSKKVGFKIVLSLRGNDDGI